METKKTKIANLEQRRTQGFLVGLIVVLALLFVALEFRSGWSAGLFSNLDLMDDMSIDIDLLPIEDEQKDMVPLLDSQKETPAELNIVDEAQQLQEDVLQAETVMGEQEADPAADKEEPKSPLDTSLDNHQQKFRVVEDLPQFPGGAVELMKWLTKNLRYPPMAQQKKIQGRVVAEFIVNADGTVSDIAIVEQLYPLCDREVCRVLSMMPKWKPGIENDKPCRTKVRIPVVFNL